MNEVSFVPLIPSELAVYIPPERILDNAGRYPEMQQEFSPGQHLAITAIKAMLLEVDLTHGTNNDFKEFDQYGILPERECHTRGVQGSARTMTLDRSLGLDHYTFMNWGNFEPNLYGRNTIGIDARRVLLSPHTIVSPKDINEHSYEAMFMSVNEMDDIDKKGLNTYLSSLVSGVAWHEIIARRFLNAVLERPTDTPAFWYPQLLGEIKHFGPIPPEYFTTQVHTEEERHEKWIEYIEKGFYIKAVSTAIGRMYGQQPKKLGINLEKPRSMWAKIIELAQS